MAIYRLLQNSAFAPEQIEQMGKAYEVALTSLKLRDRSDPLTPLLAKAVIEVAQTGESDPMRICTLALEHLDRTSQSAFVGERFNLG